MQVRAASHRRGRHKRFHIRPEAKGLGYHAFPGLFGPLWGFEPVEEPRREPDEEDAVQLGEAGPEDVERQVARTGLEWCSAILGGVVLIALIHARFGSFVAFLDWLRYWLR